MVKKTSDKSTDKAVAKPAAKPVAKSAAKSTTKAAVGVAKSVADAAKATAKAAAKAVAKTTATKKSTTTTPPKTAAPKPATAKVTEPKVAAKASTKVVAKSTTPEKFVVFVAPYFGPTMSRVLKALLDVENTRVGVITNIPESLMPKGLKIAGHFRVDNVLDAGQLRVAARAFQKEWGRVDRLIGYLEHIQVPLADAREALGIPGIHGEVARNFRDKNQMKRVLAAKKLPVAKQALVDGMVSALTFVEDVGFPVILKPVDGVGSRDTYRVRDEDELFAILNQLVPTPERPLQCEAFITGEEHTLEAVMVDGKAVWQSSTYYLPGPLQVLENPWMQYCVLLPRDENEAHVRAFRPTNEKALKALGLVTGFSHMEWFADPKGNPIIGEVGARPAGVNIMAMNGFAHDVDVWAKWVRLEVNGEWDMPPRKFACGCAFLRGHGAGRVVQSVSGVESVFKTIKGHVADHQLPKAGQPRADNYEGEGWVIVQAETTERVLELLRTVVQGIQISYR